jgi:hypothetical protein
MRHLGRWVTCVFLVLLFYGLLLGPANVLFKYTGATWIQSAYKPLDWAANSFNPLARLESLYRNVWGFP